MYYEARVHELLEVQDAEHAAQFIKSGKMSSYQVPCWTSKDGFYKMYAVPDGHIDNPCLELAILRKALAYPEAPTQQIESITNGWIKTADELYIYLLKSEKSDIIMNNNATLIGDQPNGNEQAQFICGCCGEWFSGNVQEQLKFDQDAGYGICNGCKHWYC